MKQLKLTNLGGMPFRQDRLDFFQNAIIEAFGAIANSVQRQGYYLPGQIAALAPGFRIFGCEISNDGDNVSCTEGAVYFANEIFIVEAHTIPISGATYKLCAFAAVETEDPAGIKEYFDGVAKPTQLKRVAKLQYFTFGSGLEQAENIVTMNQTNIVLSADLQTPPTMQNCIHGVPITINRINGWSFASGYLQASRNSVNRVTVYGALNSSSVAEIESPVIGSLPLGFRPTVVVRSFYGFYPVPGGNYLPAYIQINTSGEIRTVKPDGDDIEFKSFGTLNITYDIV